VWHGFTTSEIKLRQSLFIKEKGGEFLLSRDVKALSQQYNAQTVIVGTYSIGEYMVYISLRLVNAENNTILATTEFEVPLGVETGKLLKNDSLF
jgi:TolB-like protein